MNLIGLHIFADMKIQEQSVDESTPPRKMKKTKSKNKGTLDL